MKKYWIFSIFCMVLNLSTPLFAQEQSVNNYALASKLILDGHYDRAAKVLVEFEKELDKETEGQFFFLKGLLDFYKKDFKTSIVNFEKSIKSQTPDPSSYTFLAQALYSLKDFQSLINKLSDNNAVLGSNPLFPMILAKSYRELNQSANALATLQYGIKKFPDGDELKNEEIDLLLSLGLQESAVGKYKQYVSLKTDNLDFRLQISKSFASYSAYKKLLVILEDANLIFPNNEQILKQLAVTNFRLNKKLNAALLFERLALINPIYYKEAAELYLLAGKTFKSLTLNSQITNAEDRLKQRVSILIQDERFGQIIGLRPAMDRLDMLKNEELKYALAYSYFQLKQFEQARSLLNGITQNKLFEKATALRQQMQSCQTDSRKCI